MAQRISRAMSIRAEYFLLCNWGALNLVEINASACMFLTFRTSLRQSDTKVPGVGRLPRLRTILPLDSRSHISFAVSLNSFADNDSALWCACGSFARIASRRAANSKVPRMSTPTPEREAPRHLRIRRPLLQEVASPCSFASLS